MSESVYGNEHPEVTHLKDVISNPAPVADETTMLRRDRAVQFATAVTTDDIAEFLQNAERIYIYIETGELS